jgi:hypothetical protein
MFMVLCATEHEEFGKKCVTASQLLKFAQMAMNKHTLQQSTNE